LLDNCAPRKVSPGGIAATVTLDSVVTRNPDFQFKNAPVLSGDFIVFGRVIWDAFINRSVAFYENIPLAAMIDSLQSSRRVGDIVDEWSKRAGVRYALGGIRYLVEMGVARVVAASDRVSQAARRRI
jgi:hypothetical protein